MNALAYLFTNYLLHPWIMAQFISPLNSIFAAQQGYSHVSSTECPASCWASYDDLHPVESAIDSGECLDKGYIWPILQKASSLSHCEQYQTRVTSGIVPNHIAVTLNYVDLFDLTNSLRAKWLIYKKLSWVILSLSTMQLLVDIICIISIQMKISI